MSRTAGSQGYIERPCLKESRQKDLVSFDLCVNILLTWTHVATSPQCLWTTEAGIGPLGTRVTDGCELTC